jgi:hypothetical protein
MKYVIFDLDNCLADDRARIPLIKWDEKNPDKRYAEYHANVSDDPVGNLDELELTMLLGTPVFLTARPRSVGSIDVRSQTLRWIKEKLDVSAPILLMRGNNDNRPSVDLKRSMLAELATDYEIKLSDIAHAYDDRSDIVEMYKSYGINASVLKIHDVCAYKPLTNAPKATNAGEVLGAMAATFLERSGTYKDNYKMVPKLCEVLFPEGVPPEILFSPQWHLFELKLVKLSRFAISGLKHLDSIHDDAVYSAMIEACLLNLESGT